MAIAKSTLLFAALLLCLVLELDVLNRGKRAVQGIDCGLNCEYRCSKASRPNRCMRACNICCQRCDCVPPGTNANYDTCPCYANMTTHGDRHKCP